MKDAFDVRGKRVLVTGGSGFIGSALVKRLLKEGASVRSLDDESRGSAGRLAGTEGPLELLRGDVRDAQTVRRAAAGMEVLLHLAAVNGTERFYREPERVLEVAVKGMVNVLDACLAEGVGTLVVASSSEVYQTPPRIPTDETAPLSIPDPLNPRYSYATGKILSEVMALTWGLKGIPRVLVFRPHNVIGPDMGFEHVLPQLLLRAKALCRDGADPIRLPIQGTGRETRAFVFIDDLVEGVLLVLARGEHRGIYHIGTQEEQTIADVARQVGAYFGHRVEIIPGPPAAGSTARRCPDIGKLAALGYRPRYPFRDALPIVARWYDTHARKEQA